VIECGDYLWGNSTIRCGSGSTWQEALGEVHWIFEGWVVGTLAAMGAGPPHWDKDVQAMQDGLTKGPSCMVSNTGSGKYILHWQDGAIFKAAFLGDPFGYREDPVLSELLTDR